MRRFCSFVAVLGILAGMLVGRPAQAVVLIGDDSGSTRVEHIWVAAATASAQTTTWIAVGTSESGRFGVAIGLRDGMRLDFADRAWLRALERATAPRVLPPAEPALPRCAPSEPALDVAKQPLPALVLDPESLVTVGRLERLPEVAANHGLRVAEAELEALSAAGAERGVLLLVFAVTEPALTSAVRIVAHAAHSTVPMGSLRVGLAQDVGVSYFALGEEPMRLAGIAEVEARALDIRWHAATGASDYLVARETRLRASDVPLQVVEPTSSQILYDWETLPDDAGVVRSVARHYLGERPPNVLGDCLGNLISVRQGGLRVASSCAPGALAALPNEGTEAPPCGTTSDAEPVDPRVLVCGDASELAYAHAGLAPDVIVSRLATRATLGAPLTVALVAAEDLAAASVVRADEIDTSDCESPDPGGSGGASGWTHGSTSGPAPVGSAPAVYDDEVDPPGDDWYWDTTVVIESDPSSCSGSTESDHEYSGETCGGDSSGSGDGCSSDTESDYDGETCGGDGSSDGCSGESSDSGYSGETCGSGSADTGYSGETCSGDCAVSRRRRPRMSAIVFAFSALMILVRRASRPAPRRRSATAAEGVNRA